MSYYTSKKFAGEKLELLLATGIFLNDSKYSTNIES
jgi:hypothetical protein